MSHTIFAYKFYSLSPLYVFSLNTKILQNPFFLILISELPNFVSTVSFPRIKNAYIQTTCKQFQDAHGALKPLHELHSAPEVSTCFLIWRNWLSDTFTRTFWIIYFDPKQFSNTFSWPCAAPLSVSSPSSHTYIIIIEIVLLINITPPRLHLLLYTFPRRHVSRGNPSFIGWKYLTSTNTIYVVLVHSHTAIKILPKTG